MRQIKFAAHILPHIIAISVFLIVTIFFFNPIFFESKTLQQYDIQQHLGASKTIEDYRAQEGEEPLWTDTMFSGMPAYLVSVQWGNQAIALLKKVMALFLPHPIANIFLAFVCYYILLLTFGIRPYLAMAGAIAFGLSSYMIIGLAAGHNARIGAIAFMPLVVAGIHLAFTGRRLLGFGVTAAAMALHLRENHVQITYYLLLIVLIYGLIRLIQAIREKTVADLFKTVGILALAVVIGACTFFGQFWALKEYSEHSTRGKSELPSESTGNSGMTREYAFEFSNGIFEPLTLMIPNIYGGSTSNVLAMDRNSEVYQALVRSGNQEMANQLAGFTRAYWGEQRMAAPYYGGAIMVFLFVVGIAFAEKRYVWWLASAAALGIILSWGSNFGAFNYFMFDYFPGYNSFRSVTFTLIIVLFALPLLGLLGLEKLMAGAITPASKKKLLIAFASTGGVAFLLWVFAGVFGFMREVEVQLPAWFTDALAEDRKSLFRADAFRTFLFISVVFATIYFELYKKISEPGFYAFLVILVIADLASVDRRYFTNDNYKRARDNSYFAMTAADQEVLKDKSYYRVYNLSYLTNSGENPFAEARSSYYHHSIGGYHGAKLRRYQEFYDSCIVAQTQTFVDQARTGNLSFKELSAINMLNIKYLLVGREAGDVLPNPSAFGSGWFVGEVIPVGSPVEELQTTCGTDTRRVAVVDTTKFKLDRLSSDSAATIRLVKQSPRRLTYESESSGDGLAVFSEIYYPGWEATIDGQPADVIRANYILRALSVPSGKHTIEFTFNPKPYTVGNKVTTASSWLVLLLLLGSIGLTLRGKEENAA